jgi:tetratricopeptide (TPR) repeat protein
MSFQGDICSLSLSDVVQNLATNQKTGELRICSKDSERNILFRDGKAVSYSDDQGFSIGNWLVEKEILSGEQLDEALRRYKKAKRKSLGEILRDLGLIDLDEYQTYLSNLVEETLYEVLSFEEGSFEFLEGKLEASLAHREAFAAKLEYAAPSLVMEAARRGDDWQNIRRHIPSENEIYLVPPAQRKRLIEDAADDVKREAVQLMDGTRTLKQVIAALPYSRFDACKCLADLIADKKVRPMDGSVLTHFSKWNGDPRHMIVCLKTILEREPNNREILEKLTELHAEVGQRDESATCSKLLAISFLEEEDLESAEKSLRKSLEMNPKDIVTWQKLLATVRRQKDGQKLRDFAMEFTDQFKKLGLMEIVRDHLTEMVKIFPKNLKFRLELAEAVYALGDHKASGESLLALGTALLNATDKDRVQEGERILTQALKYDRTNQKVKQLLEQIRSGKFVRRKALRKKVTHWAAAALCLFGFGWFMVYNHQARGELFRVTGEVYAESLLENSRYAEAIERIEGVRKKHPFSTATFDAKRLILTLEQKLRGSHTSESPR